MRLPNILVRVHRWLRRPVLAGYDRARAIVPGYAEALRQRADALQRTRHFQPALACYDRYLAIRPNDAAVLFDRAGVLRALRRSDEALASVERALAVKPDFAAALARRGLLLRARGDIAGALASLRQALALQPDDPALHTRIIFTLNFDPTASEADKQHERAQWARQHAAKYYPSPARHDNDPDPRRRIRIGYASSYLRHDNACYSYANVILRHDPEQFEVFCYSDTAEEDEVSEQLRQAAEHWRRTRQLSDDAMAAQVRHDRIDILIDCVGQMNGNRLLVFARKPAPIQISAWGEPTGTGVRTIDYLLSSPVLIPQRNRHLFAEQIVDLPNFTGLWTPGVLPEVGPLPALSRGYVTFGSFNRVVKLSPATIRCWAAILRRLPDARLVLKHPNLADRAVQTRLAAAFRAEGIAPDALTFIAGVDRFSHFAAYNAIDIALDPFPHAGGMTSLDAMWMGVPVVSWAGETVSSRWAATSLVPLGLTDFVVDNPETYVDVAVAKAGDLPALAQLRAELRTRIATSDWGDGQRYCRLVEAAYRDMWQRWCAAHGSRAAAHVPDIADDGLHDAVSRRTESPQRAPS